MVKNKPFEKRFPKNEYNKGYSIWVVVGVAVITSLIVSVATVSLSGKMITGNAVGTGSTGPDGYYYAGYATKLSKDNKGGIGISSDENGSSLNSYNVSNGNQKRPLNIAASEVNVNYLIVNDTIFLKKNISRNFIQGSNDQLYFTINRSNGGSIMIGNYDPGDNFDLYDTPSIKISKRTENNYDNNVIGSGDIYITKNSFDSLGHSLSANYILIEPPYISFYKDGFWWDCTIDTTKTGNFGCIVENKKNRPVVNPISQLPQ